MYWALSHADPVGLLAAGCPPDEYVGEAECITARLPEVESKEELRGLVWTIFVEMFCESLAGTPLAYEDPARKFWDRRHRADPNCDTTVDE